MQQYTAANLSLAWRCRIEPTDNPSVWLAWRGGDHPVAALWIDETAVELDQAEANAQAALGHRSGPGMITVMAISASSALWSDGKGAPRRLDMPVAPHRPRREPQWYCETCKGTHPLRLMKACREGRLT